ncbi:MAG: AraC family transcriptional regulator [Herbinix sp.]|nr:AraC family transcriptional regulator [Herbinix sp.]
MKEFYSCHEATNYAMETERFAISHLLSDEKTMEIHIHSCYEIHYSIAGGKEFFISNNYYKINGNNMFFISPNENHHITKLDKSSHERINIAIHPKFFTRYSTQASPLENCFKNLDDLSNRVIYIDSKNHKRLEFLLQKIYLANGFGSELIEDHAFCEILIMLHNIQINQFKTPEPSITENTTAKNIINYINKNITDEISLDELANTFFLSKSYICRTFKTFTGTTISKYISARRISMAKALIDEGHKPSEACAAVGYNSYNNFFKSFVNIVGISPSSYSKYT